MKAYRIIGSVLSSFLTPIVLILLCAALLLFNVASLLTDSAIELVVQSALQDEEIRAPITEAITSELSVGDLAIAPETVEKIMELPTLQTLITDVVTDSTDELTSGEFDGTLDVGEKLRDVFLDEPEKLTDFSEELSDALLSDEAFREEITSALLAGDTTIPEETVDRLMQSDAVQAILSKIMEEQTAIGLELPYTPVDISGEIASFVETEPALADEIIECYLPDSESFYSAVAEASAYAKSIGAPEPPIGIGKREFVLYGLALYAEDINAQFRAGMDGGEVDYTDAETPDGAYRSDVAIEFDAETTETLNTLSVLFTFLRSGSFLASIILFVVLFYLLCSLFTFSFRYSLIFCGIAVLLTGLSLISLASLPVVETVWESGDSTETLLLALVSSVWTVLSANLLLTGIVSTVVGVAMLAGMILWTVLRKQKATELPA